MIARSKSHNMGKREKVEFTEKEIEVLINPFITAYLNDAMEQLEGQIASAKIAMARLSSDIA